jgi:hypothetical protein
MSSSLIGRIAWFIGAELEHEQIGQIVAVNFREVGAELLVLLGNGRLQVWPTDRVEINKPVEKPYERPPPTSMPGSDKSIK